MLENKMIENDYWVLGTFLNERSPEGNETDFILNLEDIDIEEEFETPDERLVRWENSVNIDKKLFKQRLEKSGLTEKELMEVLSTTNIMVKESSCDYNWLSFIEEIKTQKYHDVDLPKIYIKFGKHEKKKKEPIFLSFIEVFVKTAIGKLREQLKWVSEDPNFSLNSSFEEKVTEFIFERISNLSVRALVLELNVARIMGVLPGETEEERYNFYSLEYFRDVDAVLNFLKEYQVLSRLIYKSIEYWVDSIVQCLKRLKKDRPTIEEMYGINLDRLEISSFEMGKGDSHNKGQCVIFIELNHTLKLVYKPKSLAIDVVFQKFLKHLNNSGLRHPHFQLKVIDSGDYGWVEYIEAKSCQKKKEIKEFYWRQGSFLAILHLLNAVDFHFENTISHGQYPIPVDLESLFHHQMDVSYDNNSHGIASRKINESVLKVGMLPSLLYSKGDKKGVDISGLGAQDEQLFPREVPILTDRYSDKMNFQMQFVKMKTGGNKPILRGKETYATDYVEEIANGFKETYEIFLAGKQKMKKALEPFKNVRVRHIFRSTRRYALFIFEGTHPDYLRDGLEREMLLDKLWLEAADIKYLEKLIPSEQEDLKFCDIPYFYTTPSSRDVYDSRGKRIENFFESDSFSEVLKHLSIMDESDMEFQVSILRKSMVVIDLYDAQPKRILIPGENERVSTDAVSADKLVEAAVRVGEKIKSMAIETDEDACWIGLNITGNEHWGWNMAIAGTDLYGGTSGIAIFLAYLSKISQREDFKLLAKKAMFWVRKHLTDPDIITEVNGAFTGKTSLLYAMMHLNALFGDDSLIKESMTGLEDFPDTIAKDVHYDIIGGSAGCIISLLNFYRYTNEKKLLNYATACGEHLIKSCTTFGNGVGWKVNTITNGFQALAGFSHGASGIAWALAELADVSGNEKYLDYAQKALNYERQLFLPGEEAWMDLRDPKEVEGRTVAWCHGHAGIALSRILLRPYLKDDRMEEEINLTLKNILNGGFGGNHCLCHGDIGNMEIVHIAAKSLDRENIYKRLFALQEYIVNEISMKKWKCGMPKHVESPGLMTGLSGIGLGLLRLAYPDAVPSVLKLDMPKPGRHK